MSETAEDFERLLDEVRPKLHRYCARMTGSVVDGEDIVQDVLMKAFVARTSAGALDNPQAWLFRIAHNATLDFLRRRSRLPPMDSMTDLDALASPEMPDPALAVGCLRSFLQLPPLQRSAVILRDVLSHSLQEAAAITGTSEPALKSALQRGRARLDTLAHGPANIVLPAIDDAARERLRAYAEGFRSGDFDAVRAMLAEDVRLDLVARLKRTGRHEVGEYLGRYAASRRWTFSAGLVEGRGAMLVYDRERCAASPAYFVILEFENECVASIRDFLFAPYAMDGVEIHAIA